MKKLQRGSTTPRWLDFTALVLYLGVILALTLFKTFYQIGHLWRPENQRVREVLLEPLELLRGSTSVFGVVFDYVGNVSFFVPFGLLLVVVLGHRRRVVGIAVLIALALSISIETAQYVLSVGRSSTDDVLCNVLGAAIGAGVARWAGPRWDWVWVCLALVLVVIFAVLVGLGDRLGA